MNKVVKGTVIAVVIILLAIIVLSNTLVIVHEDEYVLVKRFNKVDRTYDESGINFITPFIESVDRLPKNVVMYSIIETDVITKDRKAMTVDSYVLWRIEDPLKFTQTLMTVAEAERRIDTVVYNALKNAIGRLEQAELIQERGGALRNEILATIAPSFAEYGVVIIRNEIKRLDLPEDNKNAVYTRMISEREQIAAGFYAEGREESQIIRNDTNRQVTIMLSEASASGEQIRAEGEREYMGIMSEAFAGSERVEFYEFIRSLDALKLSMQGGNKTLFLPIDSPLVSIFLGE